MVTLCVVTANPSILGPGFLQIGLRSGLITGQIPGPEIFLLPDAYVNVSDKLVAMYTAY